MHTTAEIQEGLRYVFQTKSPYVLLVAGSGHAGMEAAISNLLEPGETIVVGNKGIWGQRVNDLSDRYGGEDPPSPLQNESPASLHEKKTCRSLWVLLWWTERPVADCQQPVR